MDIQKQTDEEIHMDVLELFLEAQNVRCVKVIRCDRCGGPIGDKICLECGDKQSD